MLERSEKINNMKKICYNCQSEVKEAQSYDGQDYCMKCYYWKKSQENKTEDFCQNCRSLLNKPAQE